MASDWQAIDAIEKNRLILSYIEERQKVTVAEISAILGLSKSRVRAILQEMSTDGKIEKIGNNRYAYYVLKT